MELKRNGWWTRIYKFIYQIEDSQLPNNFVHYCTKSLSAPFYFILSQPVWLIVEIAEIVTGKVVNKNITQWATRFSVMFVLALFLTKDFSLELYIEMWALLLLILLVIGIVGTIFGLIIIYTSEYVKKEYKIKKKIVIKWK